MNLKISILTLILFLSGCKNKNEETYLPLEIGNKWIYTVRSGLQVRIDTLKVIRETFIDGYRGWDIQGPGGITSLYWINKILKVKYMPNLKVSPSLPLLDVSKKDAYFKWKGFIIFEGKTMAATANIKQYQDKYQEGGKKFNCLKSHLEIYTDNKTIELISWFHTGTGIICQQQRTNNYLDISLEYLTGP